MFSLVWSDLWTSQSAFLPGLSSRDFDVYSLAVRQQQVLSTSTPVHLGNTANSYNTATGVMDTTKPLHSS